MTATQTKPLTTEGAILGTAQYMSPEQLEGREADARTDIFAFGAVLYEMVTGRRAFEAPSQAAVIAAILDTQPPRLRELASDASAPPHTVAMLDDVIRRCLAKDPEEHWQCAGDLCAELKAIDAARAHVPTPTQDARRGRALSAWLVVAAIALAATAPLVTFMLRRPATAPALPIRFTVLPPKDTSLYEAPYFLSVSPEGRSLVFVARGSDSQVRLWLRPMDAATPAALPGTEGAGLAFWSPDSRSIAFMTSGTLKKTDIVGGKPTTLAPATSGGSWSSGGIILFSRSDGLYPGAGGGWERTASDEARRLPRGDRALLADLSVRRSPVHLSRAEKRPEHQGLYVASLDSTERTRISDAASSVVRVPGYILFARQRTLMAQPFDERAARVVGEPIAVVAPVQQNLDLHGYAAFAASTSGTLAYRENASASSQLIVADRGGSETSVGRPMPMQGFDVSPDGRYIAVMGPPSVDVPRGLHVFDTVRGVSTPVIVPSEGEVLFDPVWAPDGRTIAYTKGVGGKTVAVSRPALGGPERRLFEDKGDVYVEDWSRDGRYIAVTSRDASGHHDVVVPVDGGTPVTVGRSPGYSDEIAFSPNGKWLAYSSNESQRNDVYVVPLPRPAKGGRFHRMAARSRAGARMARSCSTSRRTGQSW